MHEIQENKRINDEIKRKEINRINQRLDAKSKLINVIIQVLIDNAKTNYKDVKLDIKEFASLLNTVSKIENMNIADLENLKNIEEMLILNKADAQSINAMIDNFNVLLSVNNNDAITEYAEDLKDDQY